MIIIIMIFLIIIASLAILIGSTSNKTKSSQIKWKREGETGPPEAKPFEPDKGIN